MSADNGARSSVWQGTVTVMGVPLTVHVLDDGQRVIEAESVRRFVDALNADTVESNDEGLGEFMGFLGGRGTPTPTQLAGWKEGAT